MLSYKEYKKLLVETVIYNEDNIKSSLRLILLNNTTGEMASKIDKWLTTVFYNYIKTKPEYLNQIKKLPDDKQLSDRIKKAIQYDDLFSLDYQGFIIDNRDDIEHAIGYLKTVSGDLSRISYLNAVQNGNRLIEEQNKKASEKDGELKTLMEFSDGYKFVSVLDKQGLQREGKLMQHCVGSEQQDYISQVASKTLEIWSLRDKSNNPHCTIEYRVKTKKIQQIKGKQNKGVIEKYQPYVLKFLEHQKTENIIKEFNKKDLRNLGILDINGVWYDLFNLPKGLTINGNLDLSHTQITSLPENLAVGGNLDVSNTKITSLPKNLKVYNSLNISNTKITSLTKKQRSQIEGSIYPEDIKIID